MKTLILLLAVVIAGVHSQFSPELPNTQVLQCVLNAGVPDGCTTDIADGCSNSNCRPGLESVFEECGYELAPGKIISTTYNIQLYSLACNLHTSITVLCSCKFRHNCSQKPSFKMQELLTI